MTITKKVIADIQAHAAEAYPQEACGIVTAKSKYVQMANTADDPLRDFRISPDALLKYDVGAIVHSHPDGPGFPSESDMAGQISTALPWGLCTVNSDRIVSTPYFWGAREFMPELIGRRFRHGPSGSDGCGDCYALIRDWYLLELGITLPDFPRPDGWWNSGGNLYDDHFTEAGFREISVSEARRGDVFLGRVLSDVINHGGVYLGDDMILHHLSGRDSRHEPLGRWVKLIDKWVRFDVADG